MAKLQFATLSNLQEFLNLHNVQIDSKISEAVKNSIKTVSQSEDGYTLYFYTKTAPVTIDEAAFTITIPQPTGKADKVKGAVKGHLAGLDENGNLVDSGKTVADFDAAGAANTAKTEQCLAGVGKNATIKIGTAKTGTSAAVTNSGTDTDAILNFTLPKGDQGVGISSVIPHYLANPKSQGVTRSTTGWATSAQVMTSTNKYLWCYHEFVLTNNNHLYTTPTVIGVYGDKGDPGTTDYNGLQNKPVVNGAVTAYQSDIMKSQLRNVTFSTEEPKTTDGKPGDMWVVYGDE